MTNKLLILLISLLCASIYISYLLYSEVSEQALADQFQKNEIYSKQAVISIENFFDNIEGSLNFLSKKDEIINFSGRSKSFMKNFLEAHEGKLKAITRVSPEGKIIYTFPYVEEVIGNDISDQKHNMAIIENHKPVISDVFESNQGYNAVAFAYPVFKNNIYDGSITILIPFDYIADKFLKTIRIGETGTSFLISEGGIVLFSDNKDLVGKPIDENIKGFLELEKMVDQMLSMQKGRAFYYYKDLEETKLNERIAVFEPILLENTFWSIAVTMSKDEVISANKGFIIKFVIMLGAISLLLSLLGYFMIKQRQRSIAANREKEKKYRENLEKLVNVRTDDLKKLNESLKVDIRKRKKVEQQLRKAVEKVEKSEKIKSEFLAQMSHEIRTPINTILSFTTLIRDELSMYAGEELKYGFKGIQSAGKRLIRTIDLILNMSDLQLGTHEIIPKEIDIYNDIISNLIIEYRTQAQEKNIKIDSLLKTDDLIITADSYSVNQIFANLIDNAIKYTDIGGINILINRNSSGNLYVSVIDSGVGISSEYLPNIFDEFTQEDMGYTRKFEGNGLGLALVKKYCELNKAEIKIDSRKNKGSSFTVTFSEIQTK